MRTLASFVAKGWFVVAAVAICGCGGKSPASGADAAASRDAGSLGPAWLSNAHIFVLGEDVTNTDCRTAICKHNENTDLANWNGAIWQVHRTALSQTLGPNSALHIYRSTDGGKTFSQTAQIDAPDGRDIRDPHFYQVGSALYLKCLTRVPSMETRDADTDTIAMGSSSTDGVTWAPLAPLAPAMWSLWRIKKQGDTWYSAAYADGDLSVSLFSSTDGVTWTQGAPIYTISADTPLETELTFMPSGLLLALVRMDGTDVELLGDQGRLRTKICWAMPPDYASFSCPAEFDGERLDGPLSFWWKQRLFVVARKHLGADGRKRTSLYEITGTLEGGPIAIKEWGELPSAGDTSYAGVATVDDDHVLLSWYSSDLADDETWILAMFDASDIWQGVVDLSQLQ